MLSGNFIYFDNSTEEIGPEHVMASGALPPALPMVKIGTDHYWDGGIVSNTPLRVPNNALVEMIERAGFGEVDDWIAEQTEAGDIVVTADIPLAARCLAKGALVLDTKGSAFTDNDIGSALAMRDLMNDLRQSGEVRGGPVPMTPKDRSRFLSKLDEAINAVRRAHSPRQ